ncbi:MAG: radical SAM protein, partial [Cyanobacteria bacterium P01_D01_bin.73]
MPTIISLPASAVRPAITPAPQAVYLHIPFCRRRCYYCDFAIAVTGEFLPNAAETSPSETPQKTPVDGSNSDRIRRYVDALVQEITTVSLADPSNSLPLTTIFFGGGTPSLLSVDQFDRILRALGDRFTIAPDVEISMEMDPGTFNRDKLAGFLKLGLNRVSLGVQAFQDDLLEACGRLHRRRDVERAIAMLDDFG